MQKHIDYFEASADAKEKDSIAQFRSYVADMGGECDLCRIVYLDGVAKDKEDAYAILSLYDTNCPLCAIRYGDNMVLMRIVYTTDYSVMYRRRKSISKETRERVYRMYNGHCAYCGRELHIKEMQVDHVQSVRLGGENDIANYRPACRQCNFYKSTMGVEKFRAELGKISTRLTKNFAFRLAVAYGIVEVKDAPIRFYFETFP